MHEQQHFENNIHIRFRDLDAIGHVNNAVYFSYFEDTREALLRFMGLAFDDPEVFFILAHIECDYFRPIVLRSNIVIRVRCSKIGTKSFAFAYTVQDKDDESITYAEGESVQVCMDPKANRAIAVSQKLRTKLEGIL